MGIKVEGGILIPGFPYKVTQDDTIHREYTAVADGSGDIDNFKTRDAAEWWLWMDSKIR